jgi:hypothetical protein
MSISGSSPPEKMEQKTGSGEEEVENLVSERRKLFN